MATSILSGGSGLGLPAENLWRRYRNRVASALGVDLVHAQTKYARLVADTVVDGTRWLDIGCGHQLLPSWSCSESSQAAIASRCRYVAGVDVDAGIERHKLLSYRSYARGERLPFASESFTLVTANMVVEHLADPGAVLAEAHRVLRPGGVFLGHTVNRRSLMALTALMPERLLKTLAWRLEGRVPDDVFPTHYRCNTPHEIRTHADEAGFAVAQLALAHAPGFLYRLGPLQVLEMPVVRIMQTQALKRFATNILFALRKPTQ